MCHRIRVQPVLVFLVGHSLVQDTWLTANCLQYLTFTVKHWPENAIFHQLSRKIEVLIWCLKDSGPGHSKSWVIVELNTFLKDLTLFAVITLCHTCVCESCSYSMIAPRLTPNCSLTVVNHLFQADLWHLFIRTCSRVSHSRALSLLSEIGKLKCH